MIRWLPILLLLAVHARAASVTNLSLGTVEQPGVLLSPIASPAEKWTDSGVLVAAIGLRQAAWATNNQLVGTYTSVNVGPFGQCHISGSVTQVVWAARKVGDPASAKIMLLRPTGTNVFDVIYSESVTAALGRNTNAVNWTVLEGDHFGWYATSANTEIAMTTSAAPWDCGVRYKAGEASGTGYTGGTLAPGLVLDMVGYGLGPAVTYLGDSILTGYPHYCPWLGGSLVVQGLPTNSIPNLVRSNGVIAKYSDDCRPNITAQYVNVSCATNSDANTKVIWLHVGVNDIDAGWVWADYSTNLVAIRNRFSSAKVFVSEVLPSSNLDDTEAATVRAWNASLALWVATNSATLVSLHNAFGQTRGSTGELDDLKTEYSLDGVHLNAVGLSAYALWVKTNISTWVQ